MFQATDSGDVFDNPEHFADDERTRAVCYPRSNCRAPGEGSLGIFQITNVQWFIGAVSL